MISVKETNIYNYKTRSSIFKLVLVLSHDPAAMENGFSVNNKVLKIKMHEIWITSYKLITDDITIHSLLLITKSLLKSLRCSQQRQKALRDKESLWKQNAQWTPLTNIDKEIEKVKDSIAESIKISKNFHSESLRLLDEGKKKRNFELLSRANALKRKSQEEQDETSKLEEALEVSQ